MERDESIRIMLADGLSRSEIARRLGLSPGTVSRIAAGVGYPSRGRRTSAIDWAAVQRFYDDGHSIAECVDSFGFSSSMWDGAVCRGDVIPRPPEKRGAATGETRRRVAELFEAGLRPCEIARRLDISKPVVSYHARRLGIKPMESAARRYDWKSIREVYESGKSMRECMAAFGFSSSSWADAVKRGAVVPRPQEMPMESLLVVGRAATNRTHLKARLLKAGLKENRCEMCGITEWNGKPLGMELHHVNGDGGDNRLENLMLLCGNCHSQTDNWGGRGTRDRRRAGA